MKNPGSIVNVVARELHENNLCTADMWEEQLKHYLNTGEVRNEEVYPFVIYSLDLFHTSWKVTQKRPIWQPLIKRPLVNACTQLA